MKFLAGNVYLMLKLTKARVIAGFLLFHGIDFLITCCSYTNYKE
ncbi:hypothetical protein J3D43_005647 [Paenibacillus xylanexedens]|nr:hypothetical protein [Paenibacillus xylanexedens]